MLSALIVVQVVGAVDVWAHVLITVRAKQHAVALIIPLVPFITREGRDHLELGIISISADCHHLSGMKLLGSSLARDVRLARTNGDIHRSILAHKNAISTRPLRPHGHAGSIYLHLSL